MSELSKILFEIQNKYSACTFVVTGWKKGSVENIEIQEFDQMIDAYAFAKQIKDSYEALEIFAKYFDTATAKKLFNNTTEQMNENISELQENSKDEKSLVTYNSVWYATCKMIDSEIELLEEFDF